MDRQQALLVFEQFGSRLRGADAGELRTAWITLARRYHMRAIEGSRNERAMAEINAAYEVLKRTQVRAAGSVLTNNDPRIQGVCTWAWAGHPGGSAPPPSDHIEALDERDANFVKRQLWQLSDGSKEAWTLWAFDGRRFMAPLNAYSSARLFDEMAQLALRYARVGFRRPRAIFVQKFGAGWSRILLIHADGMPFAGQPFLYDGGAGPSKDQAFVARLPSLLDDLTGVASRR